MRHSRVRRGVLISAVVGVSAVLLALGRQGQAQEPRPQQVQRFYIQGAVVFEDGTPGPPNVLIERFCGSGNAIPETHTDASGRFSFEFGKKTGFTPDATTGYGTGGAPGQSGEEVNFLSGWAKFPGLQSGPSVTGCALRATLPGFRSTSLTLGSRGAFDNPDVGEIVLYPVDDVEGLVVSMVSLRAPAEARKSYAEGSKDFDEEKWDDAHKHFEKAVAVFPQYAEAWFALGRLHEEEQRLAEAREAFERAVATDPRFVPPLIELARLDAGEARWEAVVEGTERALALNADHFPTAYFYNAVAHFNLGQYPQAAASGREAVARGAEVHFPQVLHLLALSLGHQDELEEAVVYLRRFLEVAPGNEAAPLARQQLEGIEKYLAQQQASAARPASAPPQ